MPFCRKCNEKFPNRTIIDGKTHNLSSRKFCLNCSPFGKHNTSPSNPRLSPTKKEKRICLYCGKDFDALLSELKRGNAKFCSRNCSGYYRTTTKLKPQPNSICAFCGASFYRKISSCRKSRSGLLFCCRICKDTAQQVESGFIAIQPSHYGNGNSDYRTKALRNLELQCIRCGYKKHPEILEVHHKDNNHKNNNLENLEFLCPTCHEEHHFSHQNRKMEYETQNRTNRT